MKKVIVIAAVILFAGANTWAQTDTTKAPPKKDTVKKEELARPGIVAKPVQANTNAVAARSVQQQTPANVGTTAAVTNNK